MSNQIYINNVFTPDIAVKNALNSLPWLSDTINGVDIYSGLAKSPTIFFDPSSTATKSLGTYRYPYKIQAEVQAIFSGKQAGQVLGIRRGSVLRATGTNGFNLNVYGASGKPAIICPYGDDLDLPIITGGSIVTWALHDVANNIWSYAVGATEQEVWRSDVRMRKVAYATSVADTLDPTKVNRTTFTSSVLYLRLPTGVDANDGLTEVSVVNFAFDLRYTNVAASGYIHVYGLDVKKCRNNAFQITRPVTYESISTVDDIEVIGCRASGAGADNSDSTLGRDAFTAYGPTNAIRLQNMHFAGNFATDVLNNSIELGATSKAIVENNISYNVGGNSVIELWTSNDNAIIRYNFGDMSGLAPAVFSVSGSGMLFANRERDGDTHDATNAKNFNNKAHHNLISRPKTSAMHIAGGTGHEIYHNTVYLKDDDVQSSGTSAANGWATSGTAASGFCTISNNLFYWELDSSAHRFPWMVFMGTLGAAASVPSGNNNIYFANWATFDSVFRYNDGNVGDSGTYKTALSSYNLDQNSLFSTKNAGTLTPSLLGFVPPTDLPSAAGFNLSPDNAFVPIASRTVGSTALTGIGNKYFDGKPYAAASATIGALLGK